MFVACMKQAGITIMSAGLYDACKLDGKNIEKAESAINLQISPPALRASGIKPVTDIHKCLWTMTRNVLNNVLVLTEVTRMH